MDWKVSIEGKPNQRIVVVFDPMGELLRFIGQYKPHNKDWINFSEEQHSMIIDAEQIQSTIVTVYETMQKRLDAYKEIADGFTLIKTVDFTETETIE